MTNGVGFIDRKLFAKIWGFIDLKEILVVTGMRRVGKSVLLRQLHNKITSNNKLILDIENPLDQSVFEETDYNNIYKNFCDLGIDSSQKAYIFLDEIQSYPEIVKPLKYLYDHYDIKFIVTGSSSYYLKNLFPESLAGRKLEFEMYPLDFDEFLFFKGAIGKLPEETSILEKRKSRLLYEKYIRWYDEYLTFGGFPQVVLAETNEVKLAYLKDIFKSYFQTDLLQLSNISKVGFMRDLIRLLTSRIGNKVEISRLSSELGITRETVSNYMAFLEGSYFFHFVPRYGKNTGKQVSSTNKVYISDNGMANQLARLSEGQLLENAVFLNLRKYGKVSYFHTKNQKEIDFVVGELAVEVKRTAIYSDVQKLRYFASSQDLPNAMVVSYSLSEGEGIHPACLL